GETLVSVSAMPHRLAPIARLDAPSGVLEIHRSSFAPPRTTRSSGKRSHRGDNQPGLVGAEGLPFVVLKGLHARGLDVLKAGLSPRTLATATSTPPWPANWRADDGLSIERVSHVPLPER